MPPAKYARVALWFLIATGMSACVSLPPNHQRSAQDPWESWNRGVYRINNAVDHAVLRPVAHGYVRVVPQPIRNGVHNFFENLDSPTVMLNDALQGKILAAANDLGRFVVNLAFGMGGLFDAATQFGLQKNDEDFGQTLGVWGVHPGPYVELPLFGPSDLRDAPGRLVDTYTNPQQYIKSSSVKWGLYGPKLLDTRAGLISLEHVIDSAFDPYAFQRDAYFRHRAFLVSDGNVADEAPTDLDADAPDAGSVPKP